MKKILRFTASWCQPCKSMATALETIKCKCPIEVVDIDENIPLSMKYNVRSVPLLVMVENDTVLKKMTGLKSMKELTEWIND